MKYLIALMLIFPTVAQADYFIEGGASDIAGEYAYQLAVAVESDNKFQWRLAHIQAESINTKWWQLSFQQAWQLPVAQVNWFVGGSYTVSDQFQRAPNLGSKANFHLGLFRDLGQRWRLSLRHDSNGGLATRECETVTFQAPSFNRIRMLETQRVCTGSPNSGLNFLTLSRRF